MKNRKQHLKRTRLKGWGDVPSLFDTSATLLLI